MWSVFHWTAQNLALGLRADPASWAMWAWVEQLIVRLTFCDADSAVVAPASVVAVPVSSEVSPVSVVVVPASSVVAAVEAARLQKRRHYRSWKPDADPAGWSESPGPSLL